VNPANVSRPGQINQSGAVDAIFLKVFAGEVLFSYQNATVFEPLHRIRTITAGKSAAFPKHGKTSAGYHTPGAEITGDNISAAEVVVLIDGLLLASASIANIDEAMAHFDVRGPYSRRIGEALAQKRDQRIAQAILQAARTSTPTITGDPAGTKVSTANMGTDATVLETAISQAAQTLDEKNVASDQRYLALRPAQYHLLLRSLTRPLQTFYNGGGSITTDPRLPDLYGFNVVKSNNIPSTNLSAGSLDKNTYAGDYTKTVAMAWHPDAVGTVRLLGLATEATYLVQNQATLLVAKFAEGTAPVTPECAIELAIP
jgi:hypothetical protein